MLKIPHRHTLAAAICAEGYKAVLPRGQKIILEQQHCFCTVAGGAYTCQFGYEL